jgi:hypothetical protein
MKVHNYSIIRGDNVFHRLYLTGKAVMGYDPETKKFKFLSNSPEMIAEGEQVKLGVSEENVRELHPIKFERHDDEPLPTILAGLKDGNVEGFEDACNDLVSMV